MHTGIITKCSLSARGGAQCIFFGFLSPLNKEHPVSFVKDGPALAVDSHRDGDVITGRPWLSGWVRAFSRTM
jgi:hypothetical protein